MEKLTNLRKKIEDYSYGLDEFLHIGETTKVYLGVNDKTRQKVAIKATDLK